MNYSEFDEAYEDDTSRSEAEERRLGQQVLAATIGQLKPKAAVTVTEDMPISQAIELMLDRKLGAVLVARDGHPVGIFTERDVLRKVAQGDVDRNQPVKSVMTPDPECLGLDDGIAFALNRMIGRGYRHIPVVDEQRRALGVLSVREVVAYIVSLMPSRFHNLPPEPALEARSTHGG